MNLSPQADWLLQSVRNVFAAQSLAQPPRKPSKHRPPGDDRTGPEAASIFRNKKSFSRAHVSTIRKLQRAERIERGLRPLQHDVPGKREIILKRKAI